MREMKDSGIEWIGKIPKKWLLVKYKRFCDVFAGGTPDTSRSEYYDGEIPWIQSGKIQNCDITECSRYITELGVKNSSTKLIPQNTALLAMTGATCGNVGFSKMNLYANQSVMAFVNKNDMDARYIYYSLFIQKDGILINQNGSAQAGINVENGRNLYVPYPNVMDQVRIAKKLDEIISKINRAIEKTKESIEDFKKYKELIINKVLIKGISNEELKETKYEWIPSINKNWEIVLLNKLAKEEKYSIVDGPFGSDMKNEEYVDEGVPIVQLTNIKPFYHYTEELKFITEEKHQQLIRHTAFAGDIVIAKMMPAGRACILSEKYPQYVVAADAIRFAARKNVNKKYILYCLNSYMMKECELLSKGTTRVRINLEIVKKLHIALPSLEEQDNIVNYLDTRCMEIDQLISSKEKLIEEIEAYKKSLIYEYVTGKKEVV